MNNSYLFFYELHSMILELSIPWYRRLSTGGSWVSVGCVCNTTAALPSSVAVLTPRKTSSITWILAAPAGYWLKIVHSWNLPSALSSKEPVDMPTNGGATTVGNYGSMPYHTHLSG